MLILLNRHQINMKDVISLNRGLEAKINTLNQQLFSLNFDGVEFMWGGGKPEELKSPEEKKGWQNSEIIMFPIVGAAKNDEITIDGKKYPMGQHGIARYIQYKPLKTTNNELVYCQIYKADTELRSPKGNFVFPIGYFLYKKYCLENDSLTFWVNIHNVSSKPLRYALGWHPAFRIPPSSIPGKSSDSYIKTRNKKKYSIEEIKKASTTGALRLEGENEVDYVSELGKVHLSSDFGNITVWSPQEDLICLEPVTALTDREYAGELKDKPGYKTIKPYENVEYRAKIKFARTL